MEPFGKVVKTKSEPVPEPEPPQLSYDDKVKIVNWMFDSAQSKGLWEDGLLDASEEPGVRTAIWKFAEEMHAIMMAELQKKNRPEIGY